MKLNKISGVAERDIEAGEILEYRIGRRRMRACTDQNIKAGQDLFWYNVLPGGQRIPGRIIIEKRGQSE